MIADSRGVATLDLGSIYLLAANGEGGIRTHGDPKATPVFKTGAFNRSATSPGVGTRRRTHGNERVDATSTASVGRSVMRFPMEERATTPQAVGVVGPAGTTCRWDMRRPSLTGPPESGALDARQGLAPLLRPRNGVVRRIEGFSDCRASVQKVGADLLETPGIE